MNTVIYNAHIVDGTRDTHKDDGAILIKEGIIAETSDSAETSDRNTAAQLLNAPAGCTFINAHHCAVMPSFIDMHVHFRDPGQLQKETLETGLAAAAAGGFGAVVLMPNTVPVISSQEQAADIRGRAEKLGTANVFQAVSLTNGFDGCDTGHLDNAVRALTPVATEDGREVASAAVMRDAMLKCAARGIIVSCHCEDPDFAARAKPYRTAALQGTDPQNNLDAAEHLLRLAENTATVRNLMLAAETGCRIHLAHVSTKEALDAIRHMRQRYPHCRITCEATPHHLCLNNTMQEIVNPPLRPEADRLALIEGIRDGSINCIATDHAPHTAQDKAGGAPGFTGLETAFAACHSFLVQTGMISLQQLSSCMSLRPAEILGLTGCGRIAPGAAANIVIADLNRTWSVEPGAFKSKGKYTPLAGSTLHGKIIRTIYGGKTVFEEN